MAEKSPAEHDLAAELADFRKKVVAGQPVTDQELQVAIQKLRTFRDRTAMPIKEAAATKAVKKRSTKKDVDEFFGGLL